MQKQSNLYLFLSCLIFTQALYSQDEYILVTPSFDEGTKIEISIKADAPDGVLLQEINGENKHGTMSVVKDYKIERETIATQNQLEIKIHYNIISVRTEVNILYDGENDPHATNINLADIQIAGDKDPSGNWKFSVENKPLTPDIKALMLELQAYENRKWFTDQPVMVGDTWQIYPAFTDFLMTRDLQHVETEGTMQLLGVSRKGQENIATLKFSATSKGWDENVKQGSRKANFNTQGLLQYSIDQKLDSNLTITSQLESFVQQNNATVSVVLPFTYKVNKTIVN